MRSYIDQNRTGPAIEPTAHENSTYIINQLLLKLFGAQIQTTLHKHMSEKDNYW